MLRTGVDENTLSDSDCPHVGASGDDSAPHIYSRGVGPAVKGLSASSRRTAPNSTGHVRLQKVGSSRRTERQTTAAAVNRCGQALIQEREVHATCSSTPFPDFQEDPSASVAHQDRPSRAWRPAWCSRRIADLFGDFAFLGGIRCHPPQRCIHEELPIPGRTGHPARPAGQHRLRRPHRRQPAETRTRRHHLHPLTVEEGQQRRMPAFFWPS